MKGIALLSSLLLSSATICSPAYAGEQSGDDGSVKDEFAKFIEDGKVYVSTRYRFEHVDQDGLDDKAKASTIRTRLGFDSGSFYGLSTKLEFEDVTVIGNDTYNDTLNGRTKYPVVADPEGTELNQAYLSLDLIPDTTIRGGRETLKLDNVRFIGDVGWRQNNQTYDGANIVNESVENLKLFYGFVGNVNRIFGEDSPNGDFNTNMHLFNAQYTGLDFLTVTAYTYLYDVKDSAGLSTSNYGLRLNGKHGVAEEMNLLYDGEFAYQQDYEDNPTDYSASYWRASLGLASQGFTIKAGHEVLGSDDGQAGFSTPFATLHAWNGWADKFLSTPADGLQDSFASLNYSMKDIGDCVQSVSAAAVYHYFQSDNNSMKYGSEWDFNLNAKFMKYFNAGVKYAMYDAANFATDTDKLIFTLQAVFKQ